MARYNEILAGRFNRFAQKIFSMKGTPPVPQLSGDVQMSHPYFHGAENRYLESWNRFRGQMVTAAVAAQNSCAKLRNPTTSGTICVLEQLAIATDVAQLSGTAAFMSGGPSTTDFANLVTAFNLDPRAQSPNVGSGSACQLSFGNNQPSLLIALMRTPLLANVLQFMFNDGQEEIPILPGQGIMIQTGVNQSVMSISWTYRERRLEESELI